MIMKVRKMPSIRAKRKQALYKVHYAASSIYLTFDMHFTCKSWVQVSGKMLMFVIDGCITQINCHLIPDQSYLWLLGMKGQDAYSSSHAIFHNCRWHRSENQTFHWEDFFFFFYGPFNPCSHLYLLHIEQSFSLIFWRVTTCMKCYYNSECFSAYLLYLSNVLLLYLIKLDLFV